MGILSSKESEYPKLASKAECKNKKIRGDLKFLFGYGDTLSNALEALKEECLKYGAPIPEMTPDDKNWYCGTFELVTNKTKTLYNTVWFKKKNNKHMAYIYCYRWNE